MSSAITIAKKLAETRLVTAYPTTKIAFENVSFTPPVDKYLRTNFVVRTPKDPCIGGSYYRENIIFNVFVCDKLNIGTGGALITAEEIRALFHKGLSLSESDVKVSILNTPHVASGVITSDRYVVPVSITLFVESN